MLNGSNALSLISDVYSSDEEETNDDVANQRLPVPESLKKLFNESPVEVVNDSPELHGGRMRSFPHERGNWATSVFVPYKRSRQLSLICNSFIKTCANICSFTECDDFHLSLSRTVVIRHHWIDPLAKDIEMKCKTLECFPLDFDDVGIYINDERTRTFIALKVGIGYQQLINCVTAIDQCFSEFRLPTYYEDPSFHLSLVWCVGDKEKELANLLSTLKSQYHLIRDSEFQCDFTRITSICFKTGNKIFNFKLKL